MDERTTTAPRPLIGFGCAYAPVPLIHAAGFTPWRILPIGEAPDQAGAVLHDNLCPHVKRLIDRAIAGEVPELAGLVVINSCDTMRRLADAWATVRPSEPTVLLDLPVARGGDLAIRFFGAELERLTRTLERWAGQPVEPGALAESCRLYSELAGRLETLAALAARGALAGGRAALQVLYNRSVTEPPDRLSDELEALVGAAPAPADEPAGVPVFVAGNVLPDPEAFALLERCGVRVAGEDLCTGSRQLTPMTGVTGDLDLATDQLARQLLAKPRCARTLDFGASLDADHDGVRPRPLGDELVARARDCGARGVILHVMKFCDPYLGRLPPIRAAIDAAGLPLLVLEGDCTQRSLGQQATRIEAFAEMLA